MSMLAMCMFVWKGLVNVHPKELRRNVSEYFMHKGDFVHKGQALPLLLHNLSNASICIALCRGLHMGSSHGQRWQNMSNKWKWKSLSRVWLFETSWTIYIYSPWNSPGQNTGVGEWVAYPFSPVDLPDPRTKPVSYTAGGFFTSWATREAHE